MDAFETSRATLAAYRNREHQCARGEHFDTCVCGAPLEGPGGELAHVSGWYGDRHMVWTGGRLTCVNAVCARCRYRLLFCPEERYGGMGGPDMYVIPALADDTEARGPGTGAYGSKSDAWDALRRYALVAMNGPSDAALMRRIAAETGKVGG